jgi:hypothetical protein
MAGTTEPPATLPLLGRRALATGVAAGMAAVLTGRSSLAADGTLVVANWGGDWNEPPSLWWTGYATLAARRSAWSGVW